MGKNYWGKLFNWATQNQHLCCDLWKSFFFLLRGRSFCAISIEKKRPFRFSRGGKSGLYGHGCVASVEPDYSSVMIGLKKVGPGLLWGRESPIRVGSGSSTGERFNMSDHKGEQYPSATEAPSLCQLSLEEDQWIGFTTR